VKPRKDTQRKKQQRERLDLTIAAVAISATAPTSSLKLLRQLRQQLSQLLNFNPCYNLLVRGCFATNP